MLSDQEIQRYNRQITLAGFDFEGQEKLKEATVMIVGMGGLGCSAAQYLTCAGVGHLILVDFDTVSLSNLQRQILHNEQRIGWKKVDSAASALKSLREDIKLTLIDKPIDDNIAAHYFANVSCVLDCMDNITSRNQLNELCFTYRTPLVSGAVVRMEGQITVFSYEQETPCYHCLSHLFGNNATTCVENGVMGPLVGVIGALQAVEAIKVIAHFGDPLTSKILFIDAMKMRCQELKLTANPSCPVCQTKTL